MELDLTQEQSLAAVSVVAGLLAIVFAQWGRMRWLSKRLRQLVGECKNHIEATERVEHLLKCEREDRQADAERLAELQAMPRQLEESKRKLQIVERALNELRHDYEAERSQHEIELAKQTERASKYEAINRRLVSQFDAITDVIDPSGSLTEEIRGNKCSG